MRGPASPLLHRPDAELVVQVGEAIYGPRWRAPLARAIAVEVAWIKDLERAVDERRSAEVAVPRHAMLRLAALVRRRHAELGHLVAALRVQPLAP